MPQRELQINQPNKTHQKMKKALLLLAFTAFLTSCVTIDKLNPPTSGEYLNNSDKYELMENKRTESISKTYYFCFIPFGGKGELTMQNECYSKLLKETNADGVFMPTYIFTRTRYPFFAKTVTELSGRPYKLKLK